MRDPKANPDVCLDCPDGRCPRCDGEGSLAGIHVCPACNGSGVEQAVCDACESGLAVVRCDLCGEILGTRRPEERDPRVKCDACLKALRRRLRDWRRRSA